MLAAIRRASSSWLFLVGTCNRVKASRLSKAPGGDLRPTARFRIVSCGRSTKGRSPLRVSYAPRGRRRSVGVYLPVEVLSSCGTATAPVRSKITSRCQCPQIGIGYVAYVLSLKGRESPPGRPLDAFAVESTPWRGCAGRAAAGDSVGCARVPRPVLL
jgi:hypothetical protein